MKVYQIQSHYFVAGIEIDKNKIVSRCAPIVQYMKGWHIDKVYSYALTKKWLVVDIEKSWDDKEVEL